MQIRLLRESDIAAAMELKRSAGWNQTETDWRTLLQLEPDGCFAAVLDDQLMGTTTTTCYGSELAWIGMVLVRPDQRRKGVATKLLDTALNYLHARVSTVKLDATADGKHVYERLGFEVESLIERWSRSGEHVGFDQELGSDFREQILQLDRFVFGADRSELLKILLMNSCVRCSLKGYAFARPGSDAAYVGPIVAREKDHAVELLDQLLEALRLNPVYVDFNRNWGDCRQLLSERGFTKQRDLIRMKSGPAIQTSPLMFAIAGPEIG